MNRASIALLVFLLGPIAQALLGFTAEFRHWQFAGAAIFLVVIVRAARHAGAAGDVLAEWRFPARARWAALACVVALYPVATISHFLALRLNGIDFSVYDWMLASAAHGQPMFSPIYQVNHMGVHQSWFMPLLIGAHQTFNSPYFLLTLGSTALALAVVPLWRLGKQLPLTDADACLVCSAYIGSAFVGTAVNEGFRIETLIPLALFGFLDGWLRGVRAQWISFAVLSLSIKEDIAIYLVVFALATCALAAWKGTRNGRDGEPAVRAAAVLGLAAAAVLVFNLVIARPLLLGAVSAPNYMGFWSSYGQSFPEIAWAMLTSPERVFHDLAASGWWKVFVPLGCLSVFAPVLLACALVGTVMLATAANSEAMSQFSHYYPLPIFCFALAAFSQAAASPLWRHASMRLAWRSLAVTAGLWHAGWVRVWPRLPQDAALRLSLKTAAEIVTTDSAVARENGPEATRSPPVCVQAVAIPHMGYGHPWQPIGPACAENPENTLVLLPGKDSFPLSPSDIAMLASQPPTENREKIELPGVVILRSRQIKH